MFENLERRNSILAALKLPIQATTQACAHLPSERSNLNFPGGKTPCFRFRSQSISPKTESGTLQNDEKVKGPTFSYLRRESPLEKQGVKSDSLLARGCRQDGKPFFSIPLSCVKPKVNLLYPKTEQKGRKWVELSSPATPDPTPPGPVKMSRKVVVGSGALVHLPTHFAEDIIHPIQNLNRVNNEHPTIQSYADVIALEGFSTLSPILLGKEPFALVKCLSSGTLGGRHEST